jgi:PAS domain S-box-containing protein
LCLYNDKPRSDEYKRKKIEEVLRSGQARTPDLDSLVQELSQEVSVYHQELEFQNDELRRIQAELEQSQARYRELYDNTPVGFVSYFPDLRIHSANRTFAGLVSGDSLMGRKIFTLLAPDSQDEFYHHVKELLQSGKTLVSRLRLPGPKGPIPVRMESNLLRDADGPIIRSAVSNLSSEFELDEKLKATVAELQMFRDRLQGVMLAGDVGWWQMLRRSLPGGLGRGGDQ